ncbi:MAG: hypothetical protein QOC64_471, partial [Solirubrobacteraceae bacterium]|nr:hypothetical protein [Solirubrobacteraceae bacterium]
MQRTSRSVRAGALLATAALMFGVAA